MNNFKFSILVCIAACAGCASVPTTPQSMVPSAEYSSIWKSLTPKEKEAVRSGSAFVGESSLAINITPAFSAANFLRSETVKMGSTSTDISTYESDKFSILGALVPGGGEIASCTVLYVTNYKVSIVQSYTNSFDPTVLDHGC